MLPSDTAQYLYGLEGGRVLRCPWHGWEFDITTSQAVFQTDKRRLITYRVVVEGNAVFIRIPRERLPTPGDGYMSGATESPSRQSVPE